MPRPWACTPLDSASVLPMSKQLHSAHIAHATIRYTGCAGNVELSPACRFRCRSGPLLMVQVWVHDCSQGPRGGRLERCSWHHCCWGGRGAVQNGWPGLWAAHEPAVCRLLWYVQSGRHSHTSWCGAHNTTISDAGGSLQLISMPGYGVDAYLNLQRLEGDWEEMVESEPPEHHKPSESPA